MEAILKRISKLVNERLEPERLFYNRSEVVDNWLGYPPAKIEEIGKKEIELGEWLPDSYKDFLAVTNGFRQLSFFIGNLLPVENIDWIGNVEPHLLESYEDLEEFDYNITEAELESYDSNNSSKWKHEDFKKTILISNWGDSAILLLNPNRKKDREYEIWEFANWYPGAIRSKNFRLYLESCETRTKELLEK